MLIPHGRPSPRPTPPDTGGAACGAPALSASPQAPGPGPARASGRSHRSWLLRAPGSTRHGSRTSPRDENRGSEGSGKRTAVPKGEGAEPAAAPTPARRRPAPPSSPRAGGGPSPLIGRPPGRVRDDWCPAPPARWPAGRKAGAVGAGVRPGWRAAAAGGGGWRRGPRRWRWSRRCWRCWPPFCSAPTCCGPRPSRGCGRGAAPPLPSAPASGWSSRRRCEVRGPGGPPRPASPSRGPQPLRPPSAPGSGVLSGPLFTRRGGWGGPTPTWDCGGPGSSRARPWGAGGNGAVQEDPSSALSPRRKPVVCSPETNFFAVLVSSGTCRMLRAPRDAVCQASACPLDQSLPGVYVSCWLEPCAELWCGQPAHNESGVVCGLWPLTHFGDF